jgi:hypothetical protein
VLHQYQVICIVQEINKSLANDSARGGQAEQMERTLKACFNRMFVQQELKHKTYFSSDSAYCGEHQIHSQRLGRASVENDTTEHKFIQDFVVTLYIPVGGWHMC